MLCLFETPAGFALFKVLQDKKLKDLPGLSDAFTTPEEAAKLVKLKAFSKFEDTTDALAAVANLVRFCGVVLPCMALLNVLWAKPCCKH